VINEDFIRKGNILKKHQTLLSLLAVVEVEVEVEVMRDEVVVKVLLAAMLVFLEQVRALQTLAVATVVAMVVLRVQVVHQPLRQLLFPPFPPLHHFPSFPWLCVPRLSPYTSRVLWRVLQVAPVSAIDCLCVLLGGRTNV
jgi:hypothetical protein